MASYVLGVCTGLYLGASVREHYDLPSIAKLNQVIDQVFRKKPQSWAPVTPDSQVPTAASSTS